MSEYAINFTGTTRQDFAGIVFPEFDFPGVKLDIMNLVSNSNPLKFEKGDIFFKVLPYVGTDSACCVFMLDGTAQQEQLRAIGEWIVKCEVDVDEFHKQWRVLKDEQGVIRTFVFRIYRTADFVCTEHPEMLIGEPLGMYHCPACGTMVIAGCDHGPKETFGDQQ